MYSNRSLAKDLLSLMLIFVVLGLGLAPFHESVEEANADFAAKVGVADSVQQSRTTIFLSQDDFIKDALGERSSYIVIDRVDQNNAQVCFVQAVEDTAEQDSTKQVISYYTLMHFQNIGNNEWAPLDLSPISSMSGPSPMMPDEEVLPVESPTTE